MSRKQRLYKVEHGIKNNVDRGYKFDLVNISPLSESQAIMMKEFDNGYNIVASGSSGTGKTTVALFLAIEKLINKTTNKIIIVRSAVNIRSQGFLPGTLEEKESIYTLPYKNLINYMCQNGSAWDILTKKKLIEFMSTSYIRGLTLDDCIVIVDEFQNMDSSEMESMITRIGENCQVLICGDTRQNDLLRKREISCHSWLLNVTNRLPNYFRNVHFTKEDIVRSDLCKAIICAIEEIDQ